jgi:hypothetical protein
MTDDYGKLTMVKLKVRKRKRHPDRLVSKVALGVADMPPLGCVVIIAHP